MEDYREKYEKHCLIKIPKDFDIHHIDLNHNNNYIMNLVMLPKELHNKYHQLVEELNKRYELVIPIKSVIETGSGINDYILKEQHKNEEEFIKVWYECQKWVDYRNYLFGMINNIHDIEIKD